MATSKEARRTSGAGYNAGDPVTMRGHACMEGSPAKLEPGLGESGGCLGYFGFAGAAPERRPRRELRRDWQCDTNAPRSYANHTEEIRHRLSRANGWKPPEARPFRAASAASDRPRLPAHRRDATRRRATDELRRRPSWRTSSCAIAIDNQFDPRALDDRVLPRARDSRAAPKALHDQLLPSAGDGHVISDAVFDRLTSRAGGNKLTSRHDQLNTGAAYGRPGSGAVDNALIRRNADDRLTSRAIHDRSVPSAEDSRPTPSPSSPALSYWPAADEYRAATARPGYQPNSRQAEDAAPLVRRRAEHRFSDPRAAVSAGLRRPAARERAGTVLEVSGPRCGEPRAFFTRGSCREAADQRPADAGVTREVKSGRGQDELRPPCLPQEGAEQPASMASRLQHDESRPFFTRGDSHEGADQRPTDLGGATRDIKNTWKQDEPRPLFMSQNSAEHMRHDESRPFFTRGNSSHGGAEERPADGATLETMSRWKQDEARPLCMSQEDAEHIWHGESRPFFTRGIPHEGANQRPTDPGGATLDMKNRWRQDEPRPLFMSQEGDTRRDESRPFFTRGSSHEAADQRSTDPRGETLETKKRWKQDEPQPLCMSQEDAEHPRHGESRPFFTRGNPSHEGAEQRPADPGGAAPDMKSPPRGSAPAAAQPQVPIRRGKAAAAGEAARRVHACTAGDFCHAVRFKRVRIQDWAGRLHARPLETGLPLAPADPDAAPPAALDPIPDGVPGSYLDPTAPALLSERHLLLHCQAVLQYEGAAYGVAPSRAHPSNRAGPGERTESAGFAGVPLEAHPSHRALQGGEGAPVVPSEMQHETHRDQPDNGVPSTARRSHRVVYGGERGASDGAGPGGIPPKTQQPRRVLHGSQAEVVPLRTQRPGHRAPHDGQVETRPDGADFGGSTPANRLEPDGMQKKSLHRVGHKTHLDGRLDDGCGFAGWSAPGVPAVPGRRHETDAGVVQESRSRTPRYSNDIAGWHATGRPADASVVSSAPSAAAAQWPMDPAAPAFPSQLSHVSASPGLVDYINATGGGTQHAPD